MPEKVFRRFCLLQAGYYSFQASLPGYLSAFFLHHGISPSTWGILQAAYLLSCMAGLFFWGSWVDRHHANRRFFLSGLAVSGALTLLLVLFSGRFSWVAFILYPVFGFVGGAIGTILDAWVIASFPGQPATGARSRTFGTLGWAFMMLIEGQLIAHLGYWIMPLTAFPFLLTCMITGWIQPEVSSSEEVFSAPEKTQAKPDVRNLLRSPIYMLLVATVFFSTMCTGPVDNMKVLIFENVGGNVSFLGWDSFIGCLCQAPFLMFSTNLQRFKPERRLIAGVLACFIYIGIVILAKTPSMIVVGTVLANVSFGLLYPTMREMTELSVQHSLRNTAHGIVDVAYKSLPGMISSIWAGSVIQSSGTFRVGIISLGFGLVAFLTSLLVIYAVKNQKSGCKKPLIQGGTGNC